MSDDEGHNLPSGPVDKDENQGALEHHWSNDKIELLIELVRCRSILYNMKSKDHKNSGKKELEWLKISNSMKIEVEKCKAKWKYLRGQFQKLNAKKKGKSGDGASNIVKWEFFDQLMFLLPHVAGNPRSLTNFSEALAPETDAEENIDLNTTDELDDSTEPANKRSRKGDKLDAALLEYIAKKEKKDSVHHFCMNIGETIRKLPDAVQSYAKMRIQQVLYEVEYPQYQFQGTSTQPSTSTTQDSFQQL